VAPPSKVPSPARILVVDDEPTVLRVMARVLRAAGYEVVERSNGFGGLEATLSQAIDLVVFDTIMPEMSGPQMLIEIRERQAGMPAINVTGYSNPQPIEGLEDVPVLMKPFDLDSLVSEVRRLLATRPASLNNSRKT
jgi:two-component system, cell cycle sensor histidine kinase and response regulator CckA